MKQTGDQTSRKHLYFHIVLLHRTVIIFSCICNIILCFIQVMTQIHKILICFQIRILLCHCHDLWYHFRDLCTILNLFLWCHCVITAGTQRYHLFQCFFLMRSISFDCFHQIWDQIITFFQIHIHRCKCLIYNNSSFDQPIVCTNHPTNDQKYNNYSNNPSYHLCSSYAFAGSNPLRLPVATAPSSREVRNGAAGMPFCPNNVTGR